MSLVALTLIGADSLPTAAETPRADPKLIAAIDRVVSKHKLDGARPGAAVLIHQPGKIVFQKGYGTANLKTGQPITPRTMFELASISKVFTATAVLILHDRGKLSIGDRVHKHLPELPNYSDTHPILIRDLLQHTSGLPDYMDFEHVPRKHRDYLTNDDYLAVFARRDSRNRLKFPTGRKYEYNNSNFLLLATIVERVAGQPFRKFMHDEIFKPVGMEHSFIYDRPQSAPDRPGQFNHAVAYQWRKKDMDWIPSWGTPPARHEHELAIGDGAVWTNLHDMLKWDIAVRERKLLKPHTWQLALTPSRTQDGLTNHYGLGWMLYFDDPKSLYGIGHDGSWRGFNTTYYQYIDADRTTVILSNRGNFEPDDLWQELEALVAEHLDGG